MPLSKYSVIRNLYLSVQHVFLCECIISLPAMNYPFIISLLVPELPVVTAKYFLINYLRDFWDVRKLSILSRVLQCQQCELGQLADGGPAGCKAGDDDIGIDQSYLSSICYDWGLSHHLGVIQVLREHNTGPRFE